MTNAQVTRAVKAALTRHGYHRDSFTVHTSTCQHADGWTARTIVAGRMNRELIAADRCLRSAGFMVRNNAGFLTITSDPN